jgi:outer membrane immunogenic protein
MISKFQTAAAVVALLGASVGAQAADLPARGRAAPLYKAVPAPVALAYNWTGFYAGVNVGYSFARVTEDLVFPGGTTRLGSEDIHGFSGGAQAGYNLQIGNFVYGIETDFQGGDQKNTSNATCTVAACGFAGPVSLEDRIQWFGTTRGRVGYAVDRVMFYATGGLSYINLKSTASVAGVSVSDSGTSLGYALGGGVEAAVWGNWTVKAEYLYLDAGKTTASANVVGVGQVSDEVNLRNSVIRAGVNYRF